MLLAATELKLLFQRQLRWKWLAESTNVSKATSAIDKMSGNTPMVIFLDISTTPDEAIERCCSPATREHHKSNEATELFAKHTAEPFGATAC
jgi:hypothetical protein